MFQEGFSQLRRSHPHFPTRRICSRQSTAYKDSLFPYNLSHSYPSFKDLLKCRFLWENPPKCVISLLQPF